MLTTDMPATPMESVNIAALLQMQRYCLAQAQAGLPLAENLFQLAKWVEDNSGPDVHIAFLLLQVNGQCLPLVVAPSLPEAHDEAFGRMASSLQNGSHSVAPNSVGPLYIQDVATEWLLTDYQNVALSNNWRACWAVPIHSMSGEVLGILACHFTKPASAPAPADVDRLALVAQTVALTVAQYASLQTLASIESEHRQTLDSASELAIIRSDLNETITGWNSGACGMFGWTEEEMLGQKLSCIFAPERMASSGTGMDRQALLTAEAAPHYRWHLKKSGAHFWGYGALTSLRHDDGSIVGFVRIIQDQTAQRHARQQLQEFTAALENRVEERTRERDLLWRNSLDLLLEIGPDGVLRAVNPAWTSSLGYEPHELVDQYFEPFVHPEDVKATIDAITHASQRPLEHFEVRLRHKNGSYRYFAWRAAPENGLVYANGRDITMDKKEAEQLLLASDTRMQLALAAGEMGAWEWHPRTNHVVWLHGAAALHGVAPTEKPIVLSLDAYLHYVHPEDRQKLLDVSGRAGRRGKNHHTEYRVVQPDGTIRWIEARGELFFEDSGVPFLMVGVSVDITRRKRAERDFEFLAKASSELASLVDPQTTLNRLAGLAVPWFADWCAVDWLEPDGTLNRVAVAHADPEKVRLGYEIHRRFPSDPSMPQGVWNVLRTGRAEMVAEITDELLVRLIKDTQHLAALRKLGLRSYIAVPLCTHGKTIGVITFIGAESGRLYREEDLAFAEDLARRASVAIENAELYRALTDSDRAKDVFLATLAHELRNPLAAIVNGLSLIELTSGEPQRTAPNANLMQRQAKHLTRLVDDLMDISRINTGKIQLKKEGAHLAEIVRSAIENSRPDIEAGHHHLSVNLPDEPTYIVADAVRLAQVFSNLLTNAAKYTNTGGHIAVALACTPDEFIVSIKDSGVGISADMLQNVFKLFTQITHPLERRQSGLGIGLFLVSGLVTLHGGRVEAFSDGLDQGSEFSVRLPRPRTVDVADQTNGPSSGGVSEAAGTSTSRHVLVVDDNVDAASTIAEILDILGNRVTVVHDGLAAVRAAFDGKPDAILLDIGLPGIDGYEAARQIRANEREGHRVLLIALTGWGQESDKKQALEAGFDEHWVKPVGLEKLRSIGMAT